jgi:hypothetical protein
MDLWQCLHFQSYANSVVFTDKETKQKKILLPMFPNSRGEYDFNSERNKEAQEFFKKLRLTTIPVINQTWQWGGNINCLLSTYE